MSDYTNRPSTDYTNRQTYVRETEKSSGGGIAFIVGGLVVAVGIIGYALYDGEFAGSTVVPVENNTTSVIIEPAAPAAPEAGMSAPDAEAPADPAAAAPFPADPTPDVTTGN